MKQFTVIPVLKRGDCIRIQDRHFKDIMLLETPEKPDLTNKFSGLLLSTGENVRLLCVKNHSGFFHLRRASNEVIHLETVTKPLDVGAVQTEILETQRALNQAVTAARARSNAFKRNCKSFRKKLDASR